MTLSSASFIPKQFEAVDNLKQFVYLFLSLVELLLSYLYHMPVDACTTFSASLSIVFLSLFVVNAVKSEKDES
ncbi:hypothetical protein BpHYR1_015660 [Brachionus plicatilis]|uniref:Uncharacterized protein n=1 Tax=Brachionus plicatilis TaxID=10195 RepID=A0A3M7RJ84_BRAPC|nr:hypothetical protein BpHYR1_015660 [Brachionus plicatilis]